MARARYESGDDLSTVAVPQRGAPLDPAGLSLHFAGDAILGSHPLPARGKVVIGRSPRADVRIVHPSISRLHAALHLGVTLRIEDLGGENGVRIGERRLTPGELVTIVPGQVVDLGSVMIIVQSDAAATRPRQLWSHEHFEVRLEEECRRAALDAGTFGLVRLHASGPVEASVIEEPLIATVRPHDVIAVYAPGEYELLLPGAARADAQRTIREITDQLAARAVEVRGGLACYPADGRTPEALIEAACAAVQEGPRKQSSAFVLVGQGAMAEIHRMVERIAVGTISVLLLGETGVGKEVMAEAVHRRSLRAAMPFLRLNCAALAETLLESELFGHEKGAFTGAMQAKPGLLESAEGGTVFLDEVGELSSTLQVKLLRVLEERRVWRVGALKPRDIDVRFIAATNRDLEAESTAGRFRQDLYFRLNGVTLVIPPLRERVSEIEGLCRAFVAQAWRRAGRSTEPAISEEALALLQRYRWPGNIRELRNIMERAVLLCPDDIILPEQLPLEKMSANSVPLESSVPIEKGAPRAPEVVTVPARTRSSTDGAGGLAGLRDEMVAMERQEVLDALARCAGNQTQAAKMLGISRGTLVSRLNAYKIPRPRKRTP
jgi:DNA-binding NtrC family response regulator